jgi:biopolymer transport protein ExbB/TolQ
MNPELAPADPAAPLGLESAVPALDPGSAAAAAGPQIDLSAFTLVVHADPVVQGVMVLLLLASVWCWAVILDKAFRLLALRREAKAFEEGARAGRFSAERPLASELLAAAAREWREEAGPDAPLETRGERRARIDLAMRAVVGAALRKGERGLTLLATTGSAAPFVGLFGTVWGIMHSFTGIARSQDTSLAVVAPGIAEALFATAMGLVAAIPAVIAYNKLVTEFGRTAQRFGAEIARLSGELARRRAAAPIARAAE